MHESVMSCSWYKYVLLIFIYQRNHKSSLSDRLWKTISFKTDSFSEIDMYTFTKRLRIYQNCVIRIVDVTFKKNCLKALGDFIEDLVKCNYPITCMKMPFELQMTNCNYLRTSQKDILIFLNRMIELGCNSLTLNSISSEDFIKMCNACGTAKIQLLQVFR